MEIKEQVKQILKNDAPEIPSDLIDSFEWKEEILNIDDLEIDKQMWLSHANSPVHKKRHASIRKALKQKVKLPPIITMHHNLWVVDGYARLAVYLKQNKNKVKAWVGKDPNKETKYQNNPEKLNNLRAK